MAKTLTTPSLRLAYDFTHGHLRAEGRLAECAATGQSPAPLRLVWHQIYPEKLAAAEELAERAVAVSRAHDYEQACALIGQAIDLDPLNPKLRATRSHWETYAELVRAIRSEKLDPAAVISWAAERGIGSDQLRSLWHALFPERGTRAVQLAKRAAAAIWERQPDVAVATGCEALQLDPFNALLRQAVARWRQAE
ncbi:MAG: hypothetical protein JXR83_15775 [Deltaproteobacteria bacterium]|nr:hypothetical protein [Deltaproteobacteria bacterium]